MLSNHPNVLGGSGDTSQSGAPVIGGPGSSTDTALVRWNGTTGQLVQDSNVTLATAGTALVFSGAAGLTASGSNQSITLTPSGTGALIVPTPANNFSVIFGTTGKLAIYDGTTKISVGSYTNVPLDFFTNQGGTQIRLATTGNLLLGGQTTDGTGVLQLPAANAAAGGITMGVDVQFYRQQAGQIQLNNNGAGAVRFSFAENGSFVGGVGTNGSGVVDLSSASSSVLLKSAGTTALTLDASQNATFAGIIKGVASADMLISAASSQRIVFQGNAGTNVASANSNGSFSFFNKISSYNGVSTAGWGVEVIQAQNEVTAQAAANASIATYTVGAADGSFRVSASLSCTAATVLSTTLTCSYTDKANVARTMILPVQQLTGSFIAGGLITGTGAWETPVMHIRCKAATAITIFTATGTFNTVTYSADATISQTG